METLQTRGVLGQVKAKVRAEIFAALDDEQVGSGRKIWPLLSPFFANFFGVEIWRF